MFHPRTMICFHAVPTFRNAADNQRTRKLFETLVRGVRRSRLADLPHPSPCSSRSACRCSASTTARCTGCTRRSRTRSTRTASSRRGATTSGRSGCGGREHEDAIALTRVACRRSRARARSHRTRRSRRPGAARKPRVEDRGTPVERGAAVFNNWCSACHSRGPQNAPGTSVAAVQVPGQPARGARRPHGPHDRRS